MLPDSSLRYILIFISLFSFFLVTNVQAKPEAGKKFKDWTIVCEKLPKSKKEVCNIFQNVSNEQGKIVMQIAIGYPPGKTEAQALITLPLGVLLPPGIEFTGGKAKTFRAPFNVCVNNGCVVITTLDETVLKGMKAVSMGSVKFAAAKNKVIEIPISLKGFSAAFKSLKD